ncbi:kinase-like protein [Eremomyces bilateralis CBS 781.70]|uniref:Kinase-like protein n=1 Tax=Eremomyces bilateralis CBS 781.70 TaxID=1392243 RepID=A0A6G1G5U7_9PEZI|nr:kinase-like protein [Eremomyces bilateralis CBS 781.70]KAF1813424.1 kinase-like protein [Eremomyces bilateralis CBS 781.70]
MGNSNGKPVVFTDEVNLNHFRLLRVVGKGAFGKVRIVERKDTGLTFALKYIRKDEVVRSESVRNIIRERRMLEHLNHPFLCNLRYSFQDIEYLYIVVDLMNGGDLRFHISRKAFTEEAVRFWIAQLGCALKYIHGQGIVHRDVKPDNVLLDSEGHVHLADFNVASDFTPHKPLNSKSGTLAYLAPEVYRAKGYSCEVDWWSLGVLFYECIYNRRPFDSSPGEPLAQKIMKGDVHYPVTTPPVTMVCLHAISSLLEKDRKQRIGAKSFESFIDNPFFRPIDFAALERKEIEPIFVPSSEKTNFDATYDLEELLLEEAPLEARARRQKPREQLKDDATAQEIRAEELHKMIEKFFEPFNYTNATYSQPSPTTTSPHPSSSDSPNEWPSSSAPRPISRDPSSTALDDPHLRAAPAPPATRRGRSATTSPSGSPPLFNPPLPHPPTSDPRGALHPSSPQSGGYYDHGGADAPFDPNDPHGRSHQLRHGSTRSHHHHHRDRDPDEQLERPERSGQTSHPRRGNTRSTSVGGGVQMVLDPGASWSELGVRELPGSTVVSGSSEHRLGGGGGPRQPGSVLGFLSRKKGRDRSPKAKERGVLGKEGARQIVGG